MFQPQSIIHNSRFLYICRHEDADYMRGAPLSEKLNLLRYEIVIKTRKKIYINKNGRAHIAFSNFLWRLRNGK